MRFSFRIPMALCIALVALAVCAKARNAPGYDALVRQGNTQLQAGNNNEALATANAAIKMNVDRWEAYAVAGGALINLGRCAEAKTDLNQAIQRAPEAKQPALQDLRGKCIASASGGGDASGPSYADTVRFIQDKIRLASHPNPGVNAGNDKITNDDEKYTFSVDGCQSMTITGLSNSHEDDCSANDHSCHHSDGQVGWSLTIPFKSVATYPDSSHRSEVFSTHEPTPPRGYGIGILNADGYEISAQALDAMTSQLPPIHGVGSDLGHQDWHDAVWFVSKDLSVSWTTFDNSTGDGAGNRQSGNVTAFGMPALMLMFTKAGTGGESAHVAKAVQRLVDLCVNHPDQSPKELF